MYYKESSLNYTVTFDVKFGYKDNMVLKVYSNPNL